MQAINFVVFDGFEDLDLFGVVGTLGKLKDVYELNYYSLNGGEITSNQQAVIVTQPFTEMDATGILVIPGGQGTRQLVNRSEWIASLKKYCEKASFVLTVCTGSALLAKTGLIDGKPATSNKRAFDWVVSTNEKVLWQRKARWVVADKYYTSSGVAAGMDMALGFVANQHGKEIAKKIADSIEYIWNDKSDEDLFVGE